MPAAEMSDKTLLAVAPSSPPPLGHETRDTAAQCKWHSGVIQGPASLHFPDQPQARSDRKVTTSLAWLGSRKTGDTGEWKYLPHISKLMITVGLPRRRPGSAVGVAGGRGGPCTPAPATTCSTPASTASTATTSTTTPQLNTSQTENLGQTYFYK